MPAGTRAHVLIGVHTRIQDSTELRSGHLGALSRDVDSSDARAGPRQPWGPGEQVRGAGGRVASCRTMQEPVEATALMGLGLSRAGP